MNSTTPSAPTPLIPSTKVRPASTRVSRRWVPYLGIVTLGALIVVGAWPRPLLVETGHVSRGNLRSTVNEEGNTRIRQRFTIAAPVGGQLRRITLKAGDDISAAQSVVAIIDPISPILLDARSRALAEARLESSKAALEKAIASHDFATTELRRFEKLNSEKTVSQQELESVQWRETAAARDRAVAKSTVRQVEAELATFRTDDSPGFVRNELPVEVRSPTSGRVLRVLQESSRVVTAGTPLMEIGDPTDLEVVIPVLSREGAVLPAGTPVELEQWGGKVPLTARVRRVEPSAFTKVSALGVEEKRVNVIADILTPADQRPGLGDDFRVEAKIIISEATNAVTAPSGALFRRGDTWSAFLLLDGKARLKGVSVGASNGRETQILEGLKSGDDVILYPGDRVKDGQKVKALEVKK